MSMAILAILFWVLIVIFVFWLLTHGKEKPHQEHTTAKIEKDETNDSLESASREDSEFDGAMMGDSMFPEESSEDD